MTDQTARSRALFSSFAEDNRRKKEKEEVFEKKKKERKEVFEKNKKIRMKRNRLIWGLCHILNSWGFPNRVRDQGSRPSKRNTFLSVDFQGRILLFSKKKTEQKKKK